MKYRRNDIEKKSIAMGRNREFALGVILLRAMGALRNNDAPYYDQDARISLLAELFYFRIRAESKQHFVYLQIGYRHPCSVLNVKIFSDGSGNYLNQRVSVIGWDRRASSRQWQSELFDAFPRDDGLLLDAPEESIESNVVKSLYDKLKSFAIYY